MVGLTVLFDEAARVGSTKAPAFLLPWQECKHQLKQVDNVAAVMLGLSLVQRIVELYASWVTFEFTLGHGGKAIFLLLLKRGTAQSSAATGDGDRP